MFKERAPERGQGINQKKSTQGFNQRFVEGLRPLIMKINRPLKGLSNMKWWGMIFLAFWVFAMTALTTRAAAPSIEISVSAPKIKPQVPFQLVLSVSSDGDDDVQGPSWREVPGVEKLGFQSQQATETTLNAGSGGMVLVNKKTTRFVFQLMAKKTGRFVLGPFSLSINGQVKTSPSTAVEVTLSAPAAPKKRLGGRIGGGTGFPPGFFDDEEDNLFGSFFRDSLIPQEEPAIPSRNLPVDEKDAFFLQLETDKKEVYEGEQVFASWYIYTRGSIHQFDRLKFPELKGFWKEDVEPAPNLNFSKEMVNGVLFYRALLASYAIFPIKVGPSVIDEYKIRATVSLPNGAGGFGFAQPITETKLSRPLEINVKPLPAEGRSSSFTGGVGQFQVRAYIDQQRFVQGQPLTLRVRFEGDGNAKLIQWPTMDWPPNLELYDTKAESRYFQSGKSYKDFTLLVIPKEAGVVKIPQLKFSYFDPEKKGYQEIATQELAITVAPGVMVAEKSQRLETDDPSQEPNKKLAPPLPLKEKNESSIHWVYGLPMLFIWSGVYAFLFLGFIFLNWLWLRRLYRERTLWDELNDRRRLWEKTLHGENAPAGAAEMINAIYFVLSHLVEAGGFNKELRQLLDQLPPSIRADVGGALQEHLNIWQTVAFAPEEAWRSLWPKDELQKKGTETLSLLERAVRLSEEGIRVE